MTLSAGIDAARLSVLLDLRHPLAYLALHPTLAFGESAGVEVDWLPLSVPPLHPPSDPKPDDDRGVRHRRYRAEAIAREIAVYAAAQGLELREPYRDAPADAANLGWLWVRDRSPEKLSAFLVELFRGYWALSLDASSREGVAALVDSAGADGAAFRAWCADGGETAAVALAQELRDLGLFQVPAFVVEDEVFYGRQHLPMIGWILRGRSGPVPI